MKVGRVDKKRQGLRVQEQDPVCEPDHYECGPVIQRSRQVHPRVARPVRHDPTASDPARDVDDKGHGNGPPLREACDISMGVKSCVAICLDELVRILLQYKRALFRSGLFWRIEELTERNRR